ncbi:FAD/NAD(P)-binding domain-containing protein [Rhizodiscina lignyota]|uniref:FAD/NAD(P)-binding domain-containing protein n=1 Tax=Rhizodiscina lignyota TaxID=1504668 RepID=A0A9P4I6J4_9PEZI|nr:FAD/NAD(P)-binding domain-containing protein [Rhizodiscina lignyota]
MTIPQTEVKPIKRPSSIAIVGGGLAKFHGISSTIYELRPPGDSRGLNIALAPNAVRVLQHIGVLHELRAMGHSFERMNVTSARTGRSIGGFLMGSELHYNYDSLRIHRALVQQVLLSHAAAEGIKIHYNKKLASANETESYVTLRFEDGEEVKTDFAIAADGLRSRLRDCIINAKLPYSGAMGILTMHVPKASLHESINEVQLPTFCFGTSGMIAVFPSNPSGTEIDMFSTFPFQDLTKEGWEKLEENGDAKKKIMTEKFGNEWPPYIRQLWEERPPEKMSMHPFYEAPPFEHWSSNHGRIIIIGDAAHAFSPQAGQGAAMALEDAETLAHTIGNVRFTTDHLKLIRSWERHRQARLRAVKQMTDDSGKLRAPSINAYAFYIKEWIMWAVLKMKGQTMGMKWLYDYSPEDIHRVHKTQCG